MASTQMTQSSSISTDSAQGKIASSRPALEISKSTLETSESARSRKSHKKSRFGCIRCKHRRVKCDENRPVCMACQRRNLRCSFVGDERTEIITSKPVRSAAAYQIIFPSKPRDLDTTSLETSMIQSQLLSKSGFKNSPHTRFDIDDLQLLKSFARNTGTTIGGAQVQIVYSTFVPRLAVDHPYLMHAILAVSFMHTRYLKSGGSSTATNSRYTRYHWQQCLSLFNTKVAPRIISQEADAMLITSTLINGIAFALVNDTCYQTAWPFSNRTDDLMWFGVQSGIGIIFRATFPLELSATIKSIFQNMGDESYLISQVSDLINLAPDFCKLCYITETSTPSSNPYLDTLQLLASLMRIPRNLQTVFIHLSFIGSARQDFITLLHRKDHRALLILCYWYANMCAFDCWWITIRSKTECASICLYLEQYASDAVVNLLDTPAKACGVPLVSRRDNQDYFEDLEPQNLIPCRPM